MIAPTAEERALLRELAREVAEIAGDPSQEVKARLWTLKNGLRPCRPLVLCSLPEAAWNEIIPPASLAVRDPLFRRYESDLRRALWRAKNIADDEIISGTIHVPLSYRLTDWIEGRRRPFAERADCAAAFQPSLVEYSDLSKLQFPELAVDRAATARALETAHQVFGGILDVVEGEPYYAGTDPQEMGWGCSLIDILCELRGLENLYNDLADARGFLHEAMDFLCRGTLRYLDTMEREGLLRLNNNGWTWASNTPLGSNGLACTDELPGPVFDPAHVRTRDLWGYFQAQELAGVSPRDLAEVVLPYQARVAERFGLTCYGCCEPNDEKYAAIISAIPRLRELSVPFAADLPTAARVLGDRYVVSWKPHPVTMVGRWDEKAITAELDAGFAALAGCHVIVCLRDTQTLYGEPARAGGWTRLALAAACRAAEAAGVPV